MSTMQKQDLLQKRGGDVYDASERDDERQCRP